MAPALRNVGIIGMGSYAPPKVLTNSDLEKIVDTTDEWIVTRTGITERRIVEDGMVASDLAVEAAKRALDSAGLAPGDLDLIICATITGDMPFPSTACIVQDKLGLTGIPAFDLQAGCSGWVYSLATGAQFVRSGTYNNVLIIGVDVLTSVTDWSDRATCVLFGDAAGAAVLGPVPEGMGVLATHLGADGSGGDLLKIDAGGSKLRTTEQTVRDGLHSIKMEGREVFKFAVKIQGEAVVKVLEGCGLVPDDVDLFVPHQANIRIIESAVQRLKLPPEKVFINVDKYGNTSAASIPLALDEAYRSGRIKQGDTVVTVGFGAGLTWAAAAIKWTLPAV